MNKNTQNSKILNQNDYLEQLKNWNFPFCDQGDDHSDNQLNKFCMDQRCKKTGIMMPQCAMCEEYNSHQQQNHQSKPLKMMLKDLIKQATANEKLKNKDDPLEESLKKLAKEFKTLSLKIQKLSDDIFKSLSIYQKARDLESNQKIETREIIEKLLSDSSAENLKQSLKNLSKVTLIDSDQIKINEEITVTIKKTIKNNAEKYQSIMVNSIKNLETVVQQLQEISVMKGYDDEEESQQNQKQIKSKQEIYKEIQNHSSQCENQLCKDIKSIEQVPYIGFWQQTDCYEGKEFTEEWKKALK